MSSEIHIPGLKTANKKSRDMFSLFILSLSLSLSLSQRSRLLKARALTKIILVLTAPLSTDACPARARARGRKPSDRVGRTTTISKILNDIRSARRGEEKAHDRPRDVFSRRKKEKHSRRNRKP